jgi:hypothetical protein
MMEKIIGRKVTLKHDNSYVGIIDRLYLPKDIKYYRPNDLYWVIWDNGCNGICEEKDLKFI